MTNPDIPESVVLLVDDKKRDLAGAALIAVHLQRRGIRCRLEPLEAFRAVLAADRPGMIIFNQLTAGHLVAWSKRLHEMGVLTAVLLNEGIFYDKEDLEYMAGRFHNDGHIDYYFCWNETHKEALLRQGFNKAKIEVVGIPRFDFYFKPWSDMTLGDAVPKKAGRPRILVCTNFQLARYTEYPRKVADDVFSAWAKHIPLYREYWRAIQSHDRARGTILKYLEALTNADKYDIVFRPHPREDPSHYKAWIDNKRATHPDIRLDSGTEISRQILDCDLEISCETCTTAIESWIAGKPTIELIFERDPLLYREEHAQVNIGCDDPAKLVGLVDKYLADPAQPERREIRRAHLEKWCDSPDGTSSEKLAVIVADAIKAKRPVDWNKLAFNDYRRAAKLWLARVIGAAYHFDPLMKFKEIFSSTRHAMKIYSYKKSIKPRDVRQAIAQVERLFPPQR